MSTDNVIEKLIEPVKAQKARLEGQLAEVMAEAEGLKEEIRKCTKILTAAGEQEAPKKKSDHSNGKFIPTPPTFEKYEYAIADLQRSRVGRPFTLNDVLRHPDLSRATTTAVILELRNLGRMRMVGKQGTAYLYIYEGADA